MKLMTLGAVRPPGCPTSYITALGDVHAGAADWLLATGWGLGTGGVPLNDQTLHTWDGAWTTDTVPAPTRFALPQAFRCYSPDATHQWALSIDSVLFNDGSGWGVQLSQDSEYFVDLLGFSSTDLVLLATDTATGNLRLRTWDGTAWSAASDLGAMPGSTFPMALGGVSGGPYYATGWHAVSSFVHGPGVVAQIYPGTPSIVWTGDATDTRQEQQPWGIQARTGTDIWVCGVRYDIFNTLFKDGFVVHYDGSSWGAISAPVPPTGRTYLWESISAASSTDVWVAGREEALGASAGDPHTPLALRLAHYNGSTWAVYVPPGGYSLGETTAGNDAILQGGLHAIHARTGSDVWTVGTTCTVDGPSGTESAHRSYVAHYDGTTWTEVPIPES